MRLRRARTRGWSELGARAPAARQRALVLGPFDGALITDHAAEATDAKVGKRVIEGVFDKEVGPELITPRTHAMHWGYGDRLGCGLRPAAGRSRRLSAAAKARGIPLVMLNTNGIRLARDPRFAPALAEIGVHVYLQLDGFEPATQKAIRGRDLTAEKLRALERCERRASASRWRRRSSEISTSTRSARSSASAPSTRR